MAVDDTSIVQRKSGGNWDSPALLVVWDSSKLKERKNYFPSILQRTRVAVPQEVARGPEETMLKYTWWLTPEAELQIVQSSLALDPQALPSFVVDLRSESKKSGLLQKHVASLGENAGDPGTRDFICAGDDIRKGAGVSGAPPLCTRLLLFSELPGWADPECVALITARLPNENTDVIKKVIMWNGGRHQLVDRMQ